MLAAVADARESGDSAGILPPPFIPHAYLLPQLQHLHKASHKKCGLIFTNIQPDVGKESSCSHMILQETQTLSRVMEPGFQFNKIETCNECKSALKINMGLPCKVADQVGQIRSVLHLHIA